MVRQADLSPRGLNLACAQAVGRGNPGRGAFPLFTWTTWCSRGDHDHVLGSADVLRARHRARRHHRHSRHARAPDDHDHYPCFAEPRRLIRRGQNTKHSMRLPIFGTRGSAGQSRCPLAASSSGLRVWIRRTGRRRPPQGGTAPKRGAAALDRSSLGPGNPVSLRKLQIRIFCDTCPRIGAARRFGGEAAWSPRLTSLTVIMPLRPPRAPNRSGRRPGGIGPACRGAQVWVIGGSVAAAADGLWLRPWRLCGPSSRKGSLQPHRDQLFDQ